MAKKKEFRSLKISSIWNYGMRAETESREKEFLDREMALLQKRFDAEKQKIRQQIVAEREAMYVAEGR